MKKLPTQEKCFEINGIEYHLRLIPTKYFKSNEKTRSFFTRSKLVSSEAYSFSKTRGRVECEKKVWGALSFKKLKKWEKIGTFSDELYTGLDVSHYYLTIKLKREFPKKIISIEEIISDSFPKTELNKVLIKKVGIKNRYSTLKTINLH